MRPEIPKRILMTADPIGGVWTYAWELVRALPEIEFGLATMGRVLNRKQRESLGRLPNVSLFEGAWKLEWMEDPWIDVRHAGDWLMNLDSKFCPDLVHLNGYVHATLPWHVPCLIVAHSCVLSWWQAVHGCLPPAEWNKYSMAVRSGLSAADVVVSPSRAMRDKLMELYAPQTPINVVYNGREREFQGRCSKKPLFLTAGRLWDESKNVSVLSGITARLPWPLFLAGEDNCGTESTGAGNVHRLGRLAPDELWSWYDSAAVFVAPALYEPFGLSVLEAALSGCALVLADIPSFRELWGGAALFADPRDPASWERALCDVAAKTEMRADLAARARRTAASYSPRQFAAGYLQVYSDLLRLDPSMPRDAESSTKTPPHNIAVCDS